MCERACVPASLMERAGPRGTHPLPNRRGMIRRVSGEADFVDAGVALRRISSDGLGQLLRRSEALNERERTITNLPAPSRDVVCGSKAENATVGAENRVWIARILVLTSPGTNDDTKLALVVW